MEFDKAKGIDFARLIKYCMGYIQLINPSLAKFSVYTDPIDPVILNPSFIYAPVEGESVEIPLQLEAFYTLNPGDLTDENRTDYDIQVKLIETLEEIAAKYKVSEYTKQINLNFGFLRVELAEEQVDSTATDAGADSLKSKKNTGKTWNPLFSLPVSITTKQSSAGVREYVLEITDVSVLPNIGFLQPIIGEEYFMKVAEVVNKLENEGLLQLPLLSTTIDTIWNEIKAYLKLSGALFDEDSFEANRLVVSLSAKSNYFLTQDLVELADKPDEEIAETALSGWLYDTDMNIEDPINENTQELFFPFDYDKSQLKTLSIINNRASIVQGPPGTGKSQTIANLLSHLAANGHRVLFLSQKDQALRGVKDTLKKLDTSYLYGYIPNRQSPLYSEQDERDGAAYALSGIEQYLDGFDVATDPDNMTEKTTSYVDQFNQSIEVQRQYFELSQAIQNLSDYDLELIEPSRFKEFTETDYQTITANREQSEKLQTQSSNFIAKHPEVSKQNEQFGALDFSTVQFHKLFDAIIPTVESDAYDRNSRIGRAIKNTRLKAKIRPYTSKLPRELFQVFDKALSSGDSKANIVETLKSLRNYSFYRECIARVESLAEELATLADQFGFSPHSLITLDELVTKETPSDAIAKVHERLMKREELQALTLTSPNLINEAIYDVTEQRKQRVRTYIANRLHEHLKETTNNTHTRGVVKRISRALQKSKKAYKTFDQFKNNPENFEVLRSVVPVWIMDLEDVSRLIPLEKNLFDYIIVDEASQCNLAYAVPAMFRSKHVMFFGDTEQMRDSSIRFKSNRSMEELATKYQVPEYLQIKAKDDSIKSVMDIGLLAGFKSQSLKYHYRSPKELIGFSNDNFYAPKQRRLEVLNSTYVTYKDTNKVLLNHVIEPDTERAIGDKTNYAEAEYITNLVREIQADPKTKHASIGVLTFFNEQAILLRNMIEDDRVKVSIIEGIQGDERDIIIYSFVITAANQKNRYVAMTGEGGDILREVNAGRVNVAFSRAKQQVHVVTSLAPALWPDGIWLKKYLEYVEAEGTVSFYDTKLKPFDSHFEEEFYYYIRGMLPKTFNVQNQIESSGFKIDFVITDSETGKRLAVECDGPCHFEKDNAEVRVSHDYERQDVLQSAGWNFYHVLYSDWIQEDFDRDSILEDITGYFLKS